MKDLNRVATKLGKKKQVNPILYITNEDKWVVPYLKAYWSGGKKNDATLIVGMNQNNKIIWSDSIAYSKNTDFGYYSKILFNDIYKDGNGTRDINNSELGHILVSNFRRLIEEHYERKPMSEFEYLKHNISISFGWQLLVFCINMVMSIGLMILMIRKKVF